MGTFFGRIARQLKDGPEAFNREFYQIYYELRPDFINVMRSRFSSLTVEMLEEAFQDAMHKFYVKLSMMDAEKHKNAVTDFFTSETASEPENQIAN